MEKNMKCMLQFSTSEMYFEEGSSPCLMLSRIVRKSLCICLHFSCHMLERIVSCSLLPFMLGGGGKEEKQYLTLRFLAFFTYLSVRIA